MMPPTAETTVAMHHDSAKTPLPPTPSDCATCWSSAVARTPVPLSHYLRDSEKERHVEDGGPRDVSAEQHELAGGEVDHRRGLVDQDEAERHQRVDGAHGDAGDDQLQQKHDLVVHLFTWGAPRWPPTPPNARSAPGNPWRSSITRAFIDSRSRRARRSCRGTCPGS